MEGCVHFHASLIARGLEKRLAGVFVIRRHRQKYPQWSVSVHQDRWWERSGWAVWPVSYARSANATRTFKR